MARVRIGLMVVLALLAGACGGSSTPFEVDTTATSAPDGGGNGSVPGPDPGEAGLGPITFAADVTDAGEPIRPTRIFPPGTRFVYAVFDYSRMTDGAAWGQLWEHEGEVYIDDREAAWEDGPEGWAAWYIDDAEVLPSGDYDLTLYLGDDPVQTASFSIRAPEAPSSSPAFSGITFASGVTDEWAPIGAADSFAEGITEVFAVFSYAGMEDGLAWLRQWSRDGEAEVEVDLEWDEGRDGVTYASFGYEGDVPLPPGEYGLDLYVAGEWIQGGTFTVSAEPIPDGGIPGTREELVDFDLLPAFDLLAESHNDLLRELADYALGHGVEMILSDEINSYGVYRCSPDNRVPGTLFIQQDYYHEVTWEEVAATMAHELTHAVQHIGRGACECTIENEYYAFLSQLYVLQETGRMDLLADKWGGVYDDDTGEFDSWALWEALKEEYSDCPEY